MQKVITLLERLNILHVDPSVLDEIAKSNFQRVVLIAGFAIPLHLFYILFLIVKRRLWENEFYFYTCTALHSAMLLIVTFFALFVFFRSRKEHAKPVKAVYIAVIYLYLAFGIISTLLSNLIFPTVSVVTIICIGVSAAFLISPIHSLVNYIAVYAVFFGTISYFQTNAVELVTLRSNLIAVVSISFCLSAIFWRYNITILRQKRIIENQNSELIKKNQQNEYLATHDCLTGLFNRIKFQNLANDEIERLRENNLKTCMIIVDIDEFKHINDQYGHMAGDAILKEFSDIILNNVRKSDIVARFGGDEFILLMHETTLKNGKEKTEVLRTAIENHTFSAVNGQRVTASFGLILIDPLSESPILSGFIKADCALYNAKRCGRNRVEYNES